MPHISTVIIGAGQAGLAMSRCLTDRSVPHVVLERGEIANSWKTERWNSLRLLTPNWQSRLPGHRYEGPNPDGFMTMPELIDTLESYADVNRVPVQEKTTVTAVTRDAAGYRIDTNRRTLTCDTLVLATGACNIASVPGFSAALPPQVEQITPLQYRSPAQIAPGGVLVVGASATGVQLSHELRVAGHDVILSAGEHIRAPRHYRGRDIQWWMDAIGLHGTPVAEVDDIDRLRRVPSLQLTGFAGKQFIDLNALQDEGVEITGRLAGVRDGVACCSGALANICALSDLKMNRLLATFDAWSDAVRLPDLPPPERFAPTRVPSSPRLFLDMTSGRIGTVLWATGYRPDLSWLHLPVFDRKARLIHDGGVVAPGLYVLGLPFQRHRNSALLDGVGRDAVFIADHIVQSRASRAA